MGRLRPVSGPADLEAREASRAAKLEALHAALAEQIAALRSGQDWQRWLAVAARFHHYSFHNVLLIAAQRPGATAVAGYRTWQALGRQVDQGERGIQILAPVVRHTATANPADGMTAGTSSPTSSSPPADTDVPSPASRRVSGFRVAHVFDVSQTSGDPLPQRPVPHLLTGQAPTGLWDALAAQVHARGFTLQRGPCLRGQANGLTDFTTRTVTVRPDVDDAQAVKTLAHELAHVLLHDPTSAATLAASNEPASAATAVAVDSAGYCRGRVEVEAESVAFLVTVSHGLDSGAYTFPYVAGWAGSLDTTRPETVVRATGQRVLTAAHLILTATEQLQPPSTAEAVTLDQQQAAFKGAALQRRAEDGGEQSAALVTAAAHAEQMARPVTAGTRTDSAVRHRPVPGGTRRPQSAPVTGPQLQRLADVHDRAVGFYRAHLADTAGDGRRAAELLASRGIDPETATAEWIGYAPRSWTRLVDRLRADGVSDEELLACGLALPTARGTLIDRFRDRLIFPVRDGFGRSVALLGRAVDPASTDRTGQPVPKYLNSPDTALYSKRQVLYGLDDVGRTTLAAGGVPVLVEGPMDVRAVNLAGTYLTGSHATRKFVGLAPCGTALTAAQVAVLDTAAGGLADRGVVVAFDNDAAGRAAAIRAFDLLRAVRAWPQVLDLPAEQDPADLLQHNGRAAVHAALLAAAARPLADLVVDDRLDRYADQLHWAEGKIAAGRAVAAVVATLPAEQVSRQIGRLVARLDLPADEISDLVVEAVTAHSRDGGGRLQPVAACPSEQRLGAGSPGRAQAADVLAPSAAQRAHAGFPLPLTLQPPSRPTPPAGRTAEATSHAARRHV